MALLLSITASLSYFLRSRVSGSKGNCICKLNSWDRSGTPHPQESHHFRFPAALRERPQPRPPTECGYALGALSLGWMRKDLRRARLSPAPPPAPPPSPGFQQTPANSGQQRGPREPREPREPRVPATPAPRPLRAGCARPQSGPCTTRPKEEAQKGLK